MEYTSKMVAGKLEHFYRYDNITEFYRDATKEPAEALVYRSSRTADPLFHGSDSFEQTCDRFLKGFAEGTAKAREIALKLTPFLRTVKGQKRGFKPSIHAGGNFILDAYNRGIPECCSVMQPIVSKKFASLILNGSVYAGINTNVILMRGVAVVALAQVLESNGYRVAIKWCDSTGSFGANECLHTIINIKEFNHPTELDRLAFFLADTSMERRLYFSWQETSRHGAAIVRASYGQAIELPASEIGANDIYLGAGSFTNKAWQSLEGTQAWIKETLKRYGVEFYA